MMTSSVTGVPNGGFGASLPCNNCGYPLVLTAPLYSCGFCLGDRVPSNRELLCDRCLKLHKERHVR